MALSHSGPRIVCSMLILTLAWRVVAENEILIEAETCTRHTFNGIAEHKGEVNGDRLLYLDRAETAPQGGYRAEFDFNVNKEGEYYVWLAALLPVEGRYHVWMEPPLFFPASPLDWQMDDGPWHRLNEETKIDRPPLSTRIPNENLYYLTIRREFNRTLVAGRFGPEESLGWLRLGRMPLRAGKHRLAFGVSERRRLRDRHIYPLIKGPEKPNTLSYISALDAVLITPRDVAPDGVIPRGEPKALPTRTPPQAVARAGHPGPPLMMATSLCIPWENQVLQRLGFTHYQTDSDHVGVDVDWTGTWDWRKVDAAIVRCRQSNMKWIYFPHYHWPPEWYRATQDFHPMSGLRSKRELACFSVWSPAAEAWLDYCYGALADKLKTGDNPLTALFVGVQGDFGECLFPAGWQNWAERAYGEKGRMQIDYWCGGAADQRDFQQVALQKYRDLRGINGAWGTEFESLAGLEYPQAAHRDGVSVTGTSKTRRQWLDFVEWYYGGMTRFADMACRTARRHFPKTPLMLGLGGPDEALMLGQDSTALVKVARRYDAVIRSTHGASLPFPRNCATLLKRIASACRFYGVPHMLESPSKRPDLWEVARFMEALTCGSQGFWTWAVRPLNTADLYLEYGNFLTRENPVVDVALFFPTTHHRLNPQFGYPPLLEEMGAKLRDVMDYDIADEEMIGDGALEHYRVLGWIEGQYVEARTLEAVHGWIERGGTLVKFGRSIPKTIEGEIEPGRRLLGLDRPNDRIYERGFLVRYDRATSGRFDDLTSTETKTLGRAWTESGLDRLAWALPLGKGWVIVWDWDHGEEESCRKGFQLLIRDATYRLSTLDPDKRDAHAVDTRWDGVYATLLHNGEAILYNETDEFREKTVAGQTVRMPPHSLRGVMARNADKEK